MSPLRIDAQHILGKILRGVSPHLLPAGLAVETGIMAGTVERLVLGVVGERIALMRAHDGEADDIAVRPDAAWNLGAELDQRAGSVGVGIGDVLGLVDLEVLDVRELRGGIVDARARRRGGFRRRGGERGGRGDADSGEAGPGQEFAAADIDQQITSLHEPSLPVANFHREGSRKTRAGWSGAKLPSINNGLEARRLPCVRIPEHVAGASPYFRTHRGARLGQLRSQRIELDLTHKAACPACP